MENMTTIAAFCAWAGTIIVCIILIVNAVWRWLGSWDNRVKRLNTAAWIAGIVLSIMLLIRQQVNITEMFDRKANSQFTILLTNGARNAVKLLMLCAVLACVLLLLCLTFLFVCYAVSAIWKARPGNNRGDLSEIMKSPILIGTITCGIVGVFFMMPLLMGNPADNPPSLPDQEAKESIEIQASSESQTTKSLSNLWLDGVITISNFLDDNDDSKALVKYILMFIIILGVGCAVIQILYSIIYGIITRKHSNSLIDEYSGSMGILAVGVSILWTIQKEGIVIFSSNTDAFKIISEFLKSFAVVLLIIAAGILVLEVIRLLVDMKNGFIRAEAKYLFICLVGEAALLILDVLNTLYGAVSSAVGGKEDGALDQIQERLRNSIISTMGQYISRKMNFKRTYSGFKGKSTNKRGGIRHA